MALIFFHFDITKLENILAWIAGTKEPLIFGKLLFYFAKLYNMSSVLDYAYPIVVSSYV